MLPLSARGASACLAACASLGADLAPGWRASAPRVRLPAGLAQALRLLDDLGFRRAALHLRALRGRGAGAGELAALRRRALLELRDRHPEGPAAGRLAGKDRTIIVSVYTTMVVMTVGGVGAGESPFEDLELPKCSRGSRPGPCPSSPPTPAPRPARGGGGPGPGAVPAAGGRR